MFKKIRIVVLLLILLWVALDALRTDSKAQAWKSSQYIYIYPIVASLDANTLAYTEKVSTEDWRDIEQFFNREAEQYGVNLTSPVRVYWGPKVTEAPPQLANGAGTLGVMWWSLQLRWWAWSHTPETKVKPDARIYVLYHPLQNNVALPHSIGIAKARLGLAHIFASNQMHGSNQVVVAHELLHIYGADDLYDARTNLPIFPQGYAEAEREPRYPQQFAEIMAGRIPISETEAQIPKSLSSVLIGAETAKSIGWIK
ncbi:hypothetical protein NT239_01100 [Chitinibacter sp. SCUT-21]|uniref:hypothetical protein n=1 Tax=Chitinibacter sp. SCUT-21 TaxID=2970891 RepID=UPI0035A63201